jgi:hypothetical protein
MPDKPEKNRLSVDDFIAMVDAFFVLWQDSEDFRSFVIIYISTLKKIKDFADNDGLDDHVQAKFQVLHTLLREIELLPAAAPNDPAYKDQLVQAKKLWENLKPSW